MMPEERRRETLAQPSAMKEVYGPDQDTVNRHVIVRGTDVWHLIYSSEPGERNTIISHATSDGLIIWTKQEPILRSRGPGDCDGQEINDLSVMECEGVFGPATRSGRMFEHDSSLNDNKCQNKCQAILLPPGSRS